MVASPPKNDLKLEICKMSSEVIRTCHQKSEVGANITQKQNGQSQYECSGSLSHGSQQLLPPKRDGDIDCHEHSCDKTISQPPSRDAAHYLNGEIEPDIAPKRLRHKKEMTFQDIYKEEYDEDEDEDSDWEPTQEDPKKWFCINCTMVNYDDVLYCDICGEYKETEILRHGYFASSTAQVGDAQFNSEVRDRYKDSSTWETSTNSRTAVAFDERMLLHSEMEMKSQPHPERPDRLRAIAASLSVAGIFPGRCISISGREITKEELERVHSQEHIEAVELSSSMLSSYFTPDTYANEHSAFAARLAAGLCADLASSIMGGHAKNGFALVRPPGHHAGVKQAMGFCLHNNAAIAALAAQRANAKKVLIVDWDVHHGNGTQEIFEANKSVLYISLHRHEGGRFYPGTGAASEVGAVGAEGYCVNIPWRCGGVGDNDYEFAFQQIVLPIASEFAPDLTIISAGFDAARGDPLGCCDVTPAGFARMTHLLTSLSKGRLLVILEGGYNLRSISSSAMAVIKVLLGENTQCELGGTTPSKPGLQTVMEVLQIQMKFWPKLESNLTRLLSEWPGLSFQSQILDLKLSAKELNARKAATENAAKARSDVLQTQGREVPAIGRGVLKRISDPDRVANLKAPTSTLVGDIGFLMSEVSNHLLAVLNRSADNEAVLRADLAKLQSKIDTQTTDLTRVRQKYDEYKSKYQKEVSDNAQLTKDLDASQAEVTQLKAQLEAAQKELAATKDGVDFLSPVQRDAVIAAFLEGPEFRESQIEAGCERFLMGKLHILRALAGMGLPGVTSAVLRDALEAEVESDVCKRGAVLVPYPVDEVPEEWEHPEPLPERLTAGLGEFVGEPIPPRSGEDERERVGVQNGDP